MITILGTTQCSFVFPADITWAMLFYGDLGTIAHYLPHIQLVTVHKDNCYRLMYHTVELGLYQVRIICDAASHLDREQGVLNVTPAHGIKPVKTKVGLNSLFAQGYYQSQSVFHAEGNKTRIDYSLEIRAELPTPLGLRFMPNRMLDRIADSITHWRIHEIAEGFIEASIRAFPRWQAAAK